MTDRMQLKDFWLAKLRASECRECWPVDKKLMAKHSARFFHFVMQGIARNAGNRIQLSHYMN